MLTKIMMWVSIAVVLLALLELPVTSEPVLVEIVVCALAVSWFSVCPFAPASTSLRPDLIGVEILEASRFVRDTELESAQGRMLQLPVSRPVLNNRASTRLHAPDQLVTSS